MNHSHCINRSLAIAAMAVVALHVSAGAVTACPFCSVESQTLSEETQAADAVVLAKLVKEARRPGRRRIGSADPNTGTATFQDRRSAPRPGSAVKSGQEINVVFFGESDRDKTFLITGIGQDKIDWTTPLPLSAAAVEYVRKLPTLRRRARIGWRSSRIIWRTTIRCWPRTPTTNSPALRTPSCTS